MARRIKIEVKYFLDHISNLSDSLEELQQFIKRSPAEVQYPKRLYRTLTSWTDHIAFILYEFDQPTFIKLVRRIDKLQEQLENSDLGNPAYRMLAKAVIVDLDYLDTSIENVFDAQQVLRELEALSGACSRFTYKYIVERMLLEGRLLPLVEVAEFDKQCVSHCEEVASECQRITQQLYSFAEV